MSTGSLPILAGCDDGWLRLQATAAETLPSAWWELLRRSVALRGGAKLALPPTASRMSLLAEMPLGEDIDLCRRVRQACAGLESAGAILEGRTVCLPPMAECSADLVALCGAAGWDGIERAPGQLAVALAVRGWKRIASVQLRSDGAVAVTVALMDGAAADDEPTPACRDALATLLLRTNASVRMARATVVGATARLEVVFDDRPSPAELANAFAALSVGCELAAREAEVLAHDESAARAYLKEATNEGGEHGTGNGNVARSAGE